MEEGAQFPRPLVYVPMAFDVLHEGHIRLLETAKEHGHVVVGLLTDAAISSVKRFPHLPVSQRKTIAQQLRLVDSVVMQDTYDCVPNLEWLKPDVVVHSDDWSSGNGHQIRKGVISALAQWDGKLVEAPHDPTFSASDIRNKLRSMGTTPQLRMERFHRILKSKPVMRVIEAHNGLTGLIAEEAEATTDEATFEFDSIWISSLTDSTAKGKPDIELVDFTSRVRTIENVLEVTTKPIIVDCDSGGRPEHFVYTVRTLERLGVSAAVIEDKVGLKKNSLYGTEVPQTQATIDDFCHKIRAAKEVLLTEHFWIIARIESLVLDKGVDDALRRAHAYVEAGANAILIHHKKPDTSDLESFLQQFRKSRSDVPIVVVPSAYPQVYETDLAERGVRVVIYANQLLRSAYPAMLKTAETILKHGRALEADESCLPIKDVIRLIPDKP
ncbi:MAG: phosphoenolpyruvate mutase [Myxococcota bacterium]|nr:phosphoenolpyruvate mutase [Myxococcota bacterium]